MHCTQHTRSEPSHANHHDMSCRHPHGAWLDVLVWVCFAIAVTLVYVFVPIQG